MNTHPIQRAIDDMAQVLNDAEPDNGTEAAALGRMQDAVTAFATDLGLEAPLFLS
jgi:hypothetical protein